MIINPSLKLTAFRNIVRQDATYFNQPLKINNASNIDCIHTLYIRVYHRAYYLYAYM